MTSSLVELLDPSHLCTAYPLVTDTGNPEQFLGFLFWQLGPSKSAVHSHSLGFTHFPPLMQGGVHIGTHFFGPLAIISFREDVTPGPPATGTAGFGQSPSVQFCVQGWFRFVPKCKSTGLYPSLQVAIRDVELKGTPT